MSLSLDGPPPAVPADEPWAGLLARMADESHVGVDGFCLGADVVAVPAHGGHGHRQTMVDALTQALYERYYHHHATPHLYRGPAETDQRPAFAGQDAAFRRRLAAALVHFSAERPWASAGYRVVTGTSGPASGGAGQARVYLHLLPATAPEVFARVLRALDSSGLPFTARVLDDPVAFGRPDSAVVHVARELVPTVVRVAVAERCRASSPFGRSVPAFTREVLPGVSVADDPGTGGSFGRHRCRTIADALAGAGPAADRDGRLAAVRTALVTDGLDLRALHLNPGQPEFPLGRV